MISLLGKEHENFWEELGLSRICGVVLGGLGWHLNLIHFPHERRICGWISAAMRRFFKIIAALDLPLNGGNSTWC